MTSTCCSSRNGRPRLAGRAAEHVGQHDDAGRPGHAPDGGGDGLARGLDVVVPADRDGDEAGKLADDHLGGVDQLGRQLAVRDDDDAEQRRARHVDDGGRIARLEIGRRRSGIGDVPVTDAEAHAGEALQCLGQGLGHGDGTVPSARAADGDGEVALALAGVARNQELEQVGDLAQEQARCPRSARGTGRPAGRAPSARAVARRSAGWAGSARRRRGRRRAAART